MKKTAKKILIISPVASHPQNAGNRARVWALASNIRALGYEVHFLYDNKEGGQDHVERKADKKAMTAAWDHFYAFSEPLIFGPSARIGPLFKKKLAVAEGALGGMIEKIFPRLYSKMKPHFPDRIFPVYTSAFPIDVWYTPRLDMFLHKLNARHRYDAVLAEYVFMSKALELFDASVLKIIDTHDVFTDRKEKYSEKGLDDEFFSTTKEEESRALDRADRVIAIQDKERDILRAMTKREVVTVGHTVRIAEATAQAARKRVLCVGAANRGNAHAVNKFLDSVLPLLRSRMAGFELVLAGKICDAIPDRDGCVKLGEVDDLAAAYAQADIAINPVEVGTGLKIKSIESLGWGKPLVATAVGAEGLESAAGKGLFIVSSPEEWVEAIAGLVSDAGRYKAAAESAREYARRFNRTALDNLEKILR